MKYTYRIGMHTALSVALGILCSGPVVAQSCRVQCGGGVSVMAPCNTPTDPCPRPPSGGGYQAPSYDHEAARRAQKAADDDAAAERQQAEAARIERERLAKEKREKDESDAQFIRNRDATARTLRSGIGTSMSPNDGGLRGSSIVDTGIREIHHEGVDRDLQGPQAAWKQLHCAASILTPAILALRLNEPSGRPDYTEFRYLADEASNALNGTKLRVECAKAPPMPQYSGPAVDMGRMIEAEKRLVVKARDLATKLEDARRVQTDARARMSGAGAAAPAPTPAIDSRTASVVEQQRRINRERDNAANEMARTQREFNEGKRSEESATAELQKIEKVVETLVRGKIVTWDEGLRKPAARPQAASAAEPRGTRATGSAAQ